MKIGYTVWPWIIRLFEATQTWEPKSGRSKMDFEEAVRSLRHLGYDSIECFNQLVDIYEGADDEFAALIADSGLFFECIYVYLTDDFAADIANAEKCFKFMQRHNIPLANLQAAPRAEGRPVTLEEMQTTANQASEMGKLGKRYGVTLCLHPHINTKVETEQEIEWFDQNTDPSDVAFCFDTAHVLGAGMDVDEMFRKYSSRIRYVHLKDMSAEMLDGQTQFDRFRALGQGVIDFKSVIRILRDSGYDGTLCVEMDKPPVCNYESAQTSRLYLKGLEPF